MDTAAPRTKEQEHERKEIFMKRTILQNIFISVGAIFALTQLLAAGTSDGRGLVGVGDSLPGTVVVVTNTNDSGPGSLRNALAAASDGDTIDATGVSGTILLTSGELQINHNVTINGPGAENLAVNGNATSRVFENFASDATISGFTITNGFTTDADGGGGILNHRGLKLSGTSILSNNTGNCGPFCFGSGGGINSNSGGTLTVTNCTISDNSTGLTFLSRGGGMYLAGGGKATVTDSTISGNTAGFGGGISSSLHMLTVTNSTISDNSAEFGGGIDGSGMAIVTNSAISGNTATIVGGGVYNYIHGTLSVNNSTISGNSAPSGHGGAIFNSEAATIGDTILNAGASGGTIANSGTFTSLGYNLASDNGGGALTGPGDQINTDPMLGPLQDNGGPTFTHALLAGSPAINTGNPIFIPPRYDQRGPGFPRVVHGRIDIGSFEVQR
jgi:hypothetical protein